MMSRAFSLIELLVVITIIVVLLALLMPAMDKAIYQATLVQCAANQKVVGSAAIQYAFGHRRAYPVRTNMPRGETNAWLQPNNMYSPVQTGYDIRPMLRDQLGLNVNRNMQCPLVEPLGIDIEDTLPDEFVFGNQLLYWGWHYQRGQGGPMLPGMDRLGDRFVWEQGNITRRYNLLVADFDLDRRAGGWWASHPDRGPHHMFNFTAKREGLFTAVTFPHTHSWWWTGLEPPNNPQRGPVDLNFMYDDGAVHRLDKILTTARETRTDLIPNTYDNRESMYYQVPRQ